MSIPMTIIHQTTPEALAEMLRPVGINPERFSGVIVPAAWFCVIHSISYPTLLRWISAGKVEPEPRDNDRGEYKFRLSYILRFEPEKIKGKQLKPKL